MYMLMIYFYYFLILGYMYDNFETTISNHLCSITNWMHTNHIVINSTLMNRNILYPRIIINDEIIEFFDSLMCLGVILDSNLRFVYHIDSVAKKVCCTLRRLYSLKAYSRPQDIRYRLAHSLWMSQINYAIRAYSGTWSYNMTRIERIIRKSHTLCF